MHKDARLGEASEGTVEVASGDDADALTPARRKRVLLVCSMTVVCTQLYLNAMNVTLPAIRTDLHASTGELQWSLNIYALALAAMLMVTGALGDRFGRRRIMIVGMATFTAGTVLAGAAWVPLVLIVGRGLQGLGACMLPVISLAVINEVFRDPVERAKAIGFWNALLGVGLAAGPVLAGALVTWVDWRAVFWAPLPLLALTLAGIIREVPESRDETGRRLDIPGQILTAVLMGALTYDIISFGEGIFGLREWILAGIFVLASLGFVWRETHTPWPMLDFRYFRSVPFVGSLSIMEFVFITHGGFMFVFALYLQLDLGFTPLQAGLMMLPLALANTVAAVAAGRIVAAGNYRAAFLVAGIGTLLLGVCLLPLNSTGPVVLLFVATTLAGVVLAFTNMPVTNRVLAAMPESQAGVASATTSTARQIGMSLGIAGFGAFMNLGVARGLPIHEAAHPAWYITIALGAAVAVIAVVATTGWARGTAARVRQSLS